MGHKEATYMKKKLILLSFDKIMQTHSYTVVILAAASKRFAIYTDPSIGKTLQMYLTGIDKPRPLTHDLMNCILKGFKIKILQVVINDIQETVYYARLFLEYYEKNMRHIVEIDARPSDCITLAVLNNIPVFCTQEVLEESVGLDVEP